MKTENLGYSQSDIEKAVSILRLGGLVAIPTETVYGLAADATNEEAVSKIFKAKGRPAFNPLIIHVKTSKWHNNMFNGTRPLKSLQRNFGPAR